jgi:hypothetical protein
MRVWVMLGIVAATASATVIGCGDDDSGSSGTSSGSASGTPSGTGTGTGSGTPAGTGSGGVMCDVPTNGTELAAWLAAGNYTSYPAESAPHQSAGPHFGNVRVYLNQLLFDSLTAGSGPHPRCSVSIKELYGSGTTDVGGYSVAVKVTDGDTGDDWYWYEVFEGSSFADGVGETLCTGCHTSGSDFVRSPFPLQ